MCANWVSCTIPSTLWEGYMQITIGLAHSLKDLRNICYVCYVLAGMSVCVSPDMRSCACLCVFAWGYILSVFLENLLLSYFLSLLHAQKIRIASASEHVSESIDQ